MFDSLLHYAWLIWVLPLLAALFIALGYLFGINRGEQGEQFTATTAMAALIGSVSIIIALDVYSLIYGTPGYLLFGEWMHSGQYKIAINMFIDPFGLVMLNLVALITLLTLRFSINYLHREKGYQRFFIILSLFAAAMLLLVSAGNLVLMFAGWELASICSYLLIAYAYDRKTAAANASVALISNRIGDAAFLLGIFLSFYWIQSSDWEVIYAQAQQLPPFATLSIGASLIVASLAKSGQLPFAGWLVRAQEGPTPSTAIFYGSVMVHAGVYLILRLEPILVQVPSLMILLLVIGLLSTFFGYLSGLVQTDIKSHLVFSTISQIGLMLIGIGLGWFEFVRWYLFAHASWRAYQYLHAPSAMHIISQRPKPVPLWLDRRARIYHAAIEQFWLEQISKSLLIKPTQSFARDLSNFDERLITRIIESPTRINVISAFKKVETLLSQPRYLILMIAFTYVVVL